MTRTINIDLNSNETKWIIATTTCEDRLILISSKEYQYLLEYHKKDFDTMYENAQKITLESSYTPSKEIQEKFGFDKESIIIVTEKDSEQFTIWTISSFIQNCPYSKSEYWFDQSVLTLNLDHVGFGYD